LHFGFEAFNVKGETIAIEEFLDIVKQQAEELGMGEFVKLSIAEGADPNLFVSDLSHEKIDGIFKGLPLTSIAQGVRSSLLEFKLMTEKGILDYSIEST
jgi:hypothetical protein